MDEAITITWDNEAKQPVVKFDSSVWKNWLGIKGTLRMALELVEQLHEAAQMEALQKDREAREKLRNGAVLFK